MKKIILTLMLLLPALAFAQKSEKEKKKALSDSLRIPKPKGWYLPSALRVGVDVAQLGKSVLSSNYTGYAVNADMDILGRFLLAAEAGYSDVNFSNDTFSFPDPDNYNRKTRTNNSVKGMYMRYGADWNFSFRNKDHGVLALGFRYGQATFDEELEYTVSQSNWGEHTIKDKSTGIDASWYELALSLKVAVWRNLFVGSTARYRFGLQTKGGSSKTLVPSSVPGFGRTREKSSPGISLSVMYRLQWKKPYKPKKIPKQ